MRRRARKAGKRNSIHSRLPVYLDCFPNVRVVYSEVAGIENRSVLHAQANSKEMTAMRGSVVSYRYQVPVPNVRKTPRLGMHACMRIRMHACDGDAQPEIR
jgi:hypothetical protein